MRASGFGGFGGGGPVAKQLTIAIAILSILGAIGARAGFQSLVAALWFSPADVLAGRLWQPITYAFFTPVSGGFGIFAVAISLYFLYAIGGQVEAAMGSRRFLGFYIGTAALGAILTVPVALVFGWQEARYPGLWVSLGAVTVLFAHQYSRTPIHLFFVLPVMGKQLIWISFGILFLTGLLDHPLEVVPAFFAMLAALVFAYGGFQPRRAWLRFRAYLIERELKKRSSHLSVIRGGREDEGEPGAPPKRKDGEGGSGPWLH